jgi:hypothetical protein
MCSSHNIQLQPHSNPILLRVNTRALRHLTSPAWRKNFFTLFLYKQEIKERAIQTSHTQQDRDLSPSNFKLEWAMACRLRFLGCQDVDQQIMIARRRAWTLK